MFLEQGSSATISTLPVPTALTDPRNVIYRLHLLQREIFLVCQKVIPRVSVQAPPLLICSAKRHPPSAVGRARARVLLVRRPLMLGRWCRSQVDWGPRVLFHMLKLPCPTPGQNVSVLTRSPRASRHLTLLTVSRA